VKRNALRNSLSPLIEMRIILKKHGIYTKSTVNYHLVCGILGSLGLSVTSSNFLTEAFGSPL
jgi:hypothetical protein